MRWCLNLTLAVLGSIVTLGTSSGQNYPPQSVVQYSGGDYHASTAEEGIANGFANIVRSAGQANLSNAQAASEAERARQAYIQNRALATQTYFDMRRMNAQYRNETRRKPLSQEQYIRLAKEAAPDRLSPSDLDPFSGKIQWPQQLQSDTYAKHREQLESLYQQRARGNLQTYQDIKLACANFNAALKANLNSMSPMDFVRAKNFIDSLGYEANFAMR